MEGHNSFYDHCWAMQHPSSILFCLFLIFAFIFLWAGPPQHMETPSSPFLLPSFYLNIFYLFLENFTSCIQYIWIIFTSHSPLHFLLYLHHISLSTSWPLFSTHWVPFVLSICAWVLSAPLEWRGHIPEVNWLSISSRYQISIVPHSMLEFCFAQSCVGFVQAQGPLAPFKSIILEYWVT